MLKLNTTNGSGKALCQQYEVFHYYTDKLTHVIRTQSENVEKGHVLKRKKRNQLVTARWGGVE